VNDSKKLSEANRINVLQSLQDCPEVKYAVSYVDVAQIERFNVRLSTFYTGMLICKRQILEATMQAMAQSVEQLLSTHNLNPEECFVLVDGNRMPALRSEMQGRCVIKGDSLVYSIAAASVVAKVHRDRTMVRILSQTVGALELICLSPVRSRSTPSFQDTGWPSTRVTRQRRMCKR
jgi:ribonuclease HII